MSVPGMGYQEYVLAAIATCVCLTNLAINIPVLIVTTKSDRLRQDLVTRIMRSLTVSDIGLGAVIPAVSASIAWASAVAGYHVAISNPGPFCGVLSGLFYTFGICSVSHLTLIAIVKCCVIVRPLNYFNLFTDRALQRILAGVWISSVVLGFLPVVTGGEFQLDWDSILPRSTPSSGSISLIGGIISLVAFSVCTLATIFCYTTIYLIVRKHLCSSSFVSSNRFDSFTKKFHAVRPASTEFTRSLRSSRNLFIITSVYLSTYIPIVCLIFLQLSGKFNPSEMALIVLKSSSSWCYLSASFMNPLLYILLHRSVKQELTRLLLSRRQDTGMNASLISTNNPPSGHFKFPSDTVDTPALQLRSWKQTCEQSGNTTQVLFRISLN